MCLFDSSLNVISSCGNGNIKVIFPYKKKKETVNDKLNSVYSRKAVITRADILHEQMLSLNNWQPSKW